MSDSRMNNVNVIRDRISQAHYEVNPNAVASAILERLLSGNLVPNELKR
jgi:anti-sigma28 factor (negative regulator of flagellin synthesis)